MFENGTYYALINICVIYHYWCLLLCHVPEYSLYRGESSQSQCRLLAKITYIYKLKYISQGPKTF